MKPLRFHPRVQHDIDEELRYYRAISESLEDGFWHELQMAFQEIETDPERHHIDSYTGFKRFNLKRFPHNILFIIYPDRVRIQVVRHNKRRETFGAKRSK